VGTAKVDLAWLPVRSGWKQELASIDGSPRTAAFNELVTLANCNIDFLKTNQLDAKLSQLFPIGSSQFEGAKTLRLAVLSSSTSVHLVAGLRIAGLRRGYLSQIHLSGYAQYQQELLDQNSALHRFAPEVVLISLDAHHVMGFFEGADPARALEAAFGHIAGLWRLVRKSFECQIIQQTILPIFPSVVGGNEHRAPSSRNWRVAAINQTIRERADEAGVDVLALDQAMLRHGATCWHDPILWHGAKQEIHPSAAPLFGDYVMRLVAARQGLSYKCLVLDLDNTLWGGTVGDDGVEGIALGPGSALGEAFVDFQNYLLELARRGVVLAVCSKNDEAIAKAAFDGRSEMALKSSEIACFVANWGDKGSNIREIARRLNLGLDALVFVDDSPFERGLVRRELSAVAVPELPEDPAVWANCISDAGYFEAVSLTHEDLSRTQLYQANRAREALQTAVSDLPSYLQSLEMELAVKPFDRADAPRVLQLINKTNQFNLTTKRYTDEGVAALIDAPDAITLQARLTDRYGDNGIIAVMIAKRDMRDRHAFVIEVWLMSCRVLGRQVETACMNLMVALAKRRGAVVMIGIYIETARNHMVKNLYEQFGFEPISCGVDGRSEWRLELDAYEPHATFIKIREE
jgi:FkbH-like protein